jgi:hypothetical protein
MATGMNTRKKFCIHLRQEETYCTLRKNKLEIDQVHIKHKKGIETFP